MKKIFVLTLLIILQISFLSSCANVTEENNTTAGSFENVEEFIDAVLPSVYASLRSPKIYEQGGYTTLWGDNGVDVLAVQAFESSGAHELHGYAFDSGLQAISDMWTQYYKGVTTANNFIAALDDFSADANQEALKTKAIAEARFIRALLYFDMVKIWGDIPLIVNGTTSLNGVTQNTNVGNSTAAEVYLQIEKDLLYVEQFGISKSNTRGNDVATQEAASALLGKVYLQMTTKNNFGGVEGGINSNGNQVSITQRYEMAKTSLEKVIGKYSLEDNFANVFAVDNELSNSEVIFSVAFAGPGLNTGSDYGDVLGPIGNGINGGFNSYKPNLDLCFDYFKLDGIVSKTNTAANGFAQIDFTKGVLGSYFNFSPAAILLDPHNFISDARFETSIARYLAVQRANLLSGVGNLASSSVNNVGVGGWGILKYDKPIPNPNAPGEGNADFPYLRYADVLLMYAEVLNELGDQSNALEYANMVRRRALKKQIIKQIPAPITSYTLPDLANNVAGTPQSELNQLIANNLVTLDATDIQERLIPSGLSKEGLLEAILLERKLELAFEGKRKDDLLRTGKIQEAVDAVRRNSSNLVNESLLPKDKFELPMHTHLPIPQIELDLNPNLKQNCNYGSSSAGCF